jgi:HSP20 family protein
MAIKDLVPWKWGEKQVPVKRVEQDPIDTINQNLNRLFDDFFYGSSLIPFNQNWGSFNPSIDVTETDKDYKVSAELPGLDENDIEVSLDRNILTISGEKKTEKEDKDQNYYRMERSYGSFQRCLSFPSNIESDNINANFKNGALQITIPKQPRPVKKIEIKAK